MTIYDILDKALALQGETAIGSVTPERIGSIMADILEYMNEWQVLSSSPVIQKIYSSSAEMRADTAPISELSGRAFARGQLASIVGKTDDVELGDIYRYDGTSSTGSTWTYLGKIGGTSESLADFVRRENVHMLDFTIWDVKSLYESGVPGSVIRVDADALSDAIDQGKIIAIKTDSSFNGLTIVNAYKEDMIYLVFATYGGCYSVDVELNGEFRLDNIGYFSYSGVTETLRELSGVVQINEESIESLEVIVEDLQNMKIDKQADDYYPQLSVGLADNLAGREDATPSEIGFRKSGGGAILDGNARIESIKGNSVVWNQTAFPFSNTSKYSPANVRNLVYENGVLSCEVTSLDGAESYLESYVTCKANHKYLASIDVYSYTTSSGLYVYAGAHLITNAKKVSKVNQWERCELMLESSTYSKSSRFRPYLASKSQITEVGVVKFKNALFIDLTQMFGANNEPSTVEEFYARIPQNIDLYAYNEGEVIHNNTDAVKSVGFNQWDEELELGIIGRNDNGDLIKTTSSTQLCSKNWIKVLPNKTYNAFCNKADFGGFFVLGFAETDGKNGSQLLSRSGGSSFTTKADTNYILFSMAAEYGTSYNNDICINLSDSSRNGTYEPYISREQRLDIIGKYFPNGMRSAGTAHDEIRYNKATQKWEAVKRFGEVDLGTLSWSASSAGTNIFIARYSGIKSFGYGSRNVNWICSKYFVQRSVSDDILVSDKYITQREYPENVLGTIIVKDTSYTDAATFKSAMNGVILYYELDEPIVTEIEEDINLDYEVWNGGTEEAIADTPSTPLKADVVYGFNAYGVIKDLREQVAAMQAMMAQMQLAMASVTNSNSEEWQDESN